MNDDTTRRENGQEKGMRLAKFLATAGIGSRRSCEAYVQEGRVTVNGEAVTEPGTCVTGADDVRFEGKPVSLSDKKVYLMLNKPVGFTCSARDVHAQNLVYQLIPERFGRVFTVGRLDRDSEGLLLLTNDGDFAQKLTHPSHQIYKRYYVECAGRFTTAVRRQLMEGMYDNGEFLQALNVEQVSVQYGFCKLIFTLGEGRKREVRRLCKDVGLRVELLRRVGIGQLELDAQLTPGSWRIMSPRDCELALQPIAVPERPRPTHPPRPYWVKDKPERPEQSRGTAGRPSARRRDFGEEEERPRATFRAAGRKSLRPQPKIEHQRPWYEEDMPVEEGQNEGSVQRTRRRPVRPSRDQGDYDFPERKPARRRPGRPSRDQGDYDFPERKPARRKSGEPPRNDAGFRRNKPPRSWR